MVTSHYWEKAETNIRVRRQGWKNQKQNSPEIALPVAVSDERYWKEPSALFRLRKSSTKVNNENYSDKIVIVISEVEKCFLIFFSHIFAIILKLCNHQQKIKRSSDYLPSTDLIHNKSKYMENHSRISRWWTKFWWTILN